MGSNGRPKRRTGRRVVGAAVIAGLLVSGWWLLTEPRREAMVSDAGTLSPPAAVATTRSDEPLPPEPQSAPRPSPVAAAPAPAPAPEPLRATGVAYRDWSPSVALLPIDLGAMGPSLKLALDAVRNNDMAFCFRDLERAREAPNAGWIPIREGDLLLYLEAREGAVDVVDATVARPGNLPSAVLDCCREVLRGMEIKVFFAVPGQRYRYVYEVEE